MDERFKNKLDLNIADSNTICVIPNPRESCPVCDLGRMEYDGLLILTCTKCGFQVPGGGFT